MAHSGRHFKINYGVYAFYLKNTYCGNIMYGRQGYTYQDGMIACFAPVRLRRQRYEEYSGAR